MHPNPLLDPFLCDYVAARQQELLDVARATRLRGTLVPRTRRGDVACAGTDAGGGGSAGLGVEPEAAHTPEKLRAA
jgi:hypothetical protein